MQPEKFAEVYLQNQQHIHRVLKGKHIFDEERLHDTYIALYDHRPHPEPEDFAKRQPRERNRRRNCKILRLYLSGLSESEISYKLKISQPSVNQSLQLTIERLKLIGSI